LSVQKAARLEVRLSVHEREAIEAKAKSLGMNLSDYVRFAALAAEGAQGIASEPRPETANGSDLSAAAPSPPEPRYRCPVVTCEFTAPSAKAYCRDHGRLVV
jgi:hypothetical protein